MSFEKKCFSIGQKTNIIFGVGTIVQIGEQLKMRGITNALCVYDDVMESSGIAPRAIESIEKAGIKVIKYGGVRPEAPLNTIDEGTAIARSNDIDAIVGIGGGSAMDTAKAINTLINNPDPISQYYVGISPAAPQKPGVFLAMIPTTSGTGSEMTQGAVVYDVEKNVKNSVIGPGCNTDLAIVDPELTVGVPPTGTAATGLDALSHIVGSYTNLSPNPWCDALIESVMPLIFKYLPVAYKNPNDLEARAAMSYASMIAGTAMHDNFPHLDHALGHSLGAVGHVVHGFACGLTLPYELEIVSKVYPERVKRIGGFLGLCFDETESNEEICRKTCEKLISFYREIEVGPLKKYVTLTEADIDKIVDLTMGETTYMLLPCPLDRAALREYVVKMNNEE